MALREDVDGPSFRHLETAMPRTVLAAVVAAELRAGAFDEAGRTEVLELVRRFDRVGRIVTPTAESWSDAARQIGARLVTANVGDFRLLRRYLRFELEAPQSRG